MADVAAAGDSSSNQLFKMYGHGVTISHGKDVNVTLPWHDVVGCHVERGSPATVLIYTYSVGKKRHRSRKVFKISVPTFTQAKQCQASLLTALRLSHTFQSNNNYLGDSITSLQLENCELASSSLSAVRITKPVLILVNPSSGSGKAYQLFLDQVNPVLADADIPYQLLVTRSLDHVDDILRNADLSSISAILIVSGDGLFYSAINCLMSRPDAETAIKTPVGIIPAGSGNAIISSLLSYIGEFRADRLVLHSVFSLAKCNLNSVIPLDLGEVTVTGQSSPLYSSLSITWGVVADVDSESEKYRMFGGARFGMVLVSKMLSFKGFKDYRGRLTYCPLDVDVDQALPDLSAPLPDTWVVEEGTWCAFTACLLSHLAEDFCPCPLALPDDGLFHIVLIPSPCSRRNLIRIFTSCSDGTTPLEGMAGARIIRTRAFRLEPHTQPGNMMVDGEKVPCGPIQARLLPQKARFFLSKPNSGVSDKSKGG